MKLHVASQNAEIIDLKAYRDRRAGERAQSGGVASVPPSVQDQVTPMSFAMPAALSVFWPTWVFSPQFAAVQPHGENGAG
jgi:hypothetical protein